LLSSFQCYCTWFGSLRSPRRATFWILKVETRNCRKTKYLLIDKDVGCLMCSFSHQFKNIFIWGGGEGAGKSSCLDFYFCRP